MESVFNLHVKLVGEPHDGTVVDACAVCEPAPIHGIGKQVGEDIGPVGVPELVDVERVGPVVLEPERRAWTLPPGPRLVEVDCDHRAGGDRSHEGETSGKYPR